MMIPGKFRYLLAAGFTILFAVALWFRVSSLGAFPGHNGDESYYGLQTARLLRGDSFAVRTPSRNLLNPYLVVLQSPFHLVARPSVWVLRTPAVLCGVLAVVLTYVLGARALDRTTALISSVILSTLPCAIYNSRVGLEMSQLPLFGIIVIAFALRGHGLGLLLAFLASLLVHPTAIFLFPIALPIFLVQFYRKGEGDPVRQRRMLIMSVIVALLIACAFSVLILWHPLTQLYLRKRPSIDWPRFLDGYERLLFFFYGPIPRAILRLHRWIFRGLVLFLLTFGMWRLVRERQWERLALIAGLAASLSGFHLIAGPRMLREYGTYRYGIVFLMPTVLAFACLLRAVLTNPAREGATRPAQHLVPLAVALVLGCALLLSTKQSILDPARMGIRESFWTFQSDGKDEFERALSLIQRDIARTRASHHPDAKTPTEFATCTPIVVHDYWAFFPLAYLASSSKDLEVLWLISDREMGRRSLDDITREKERELRDRLLSGTYVVDRVGIPYEAGGNVIPYTVLALFPPERVQWWPVLNRGGGPALNVYRLKDGPAPLASAQPAPAGGVPNVRR